MRSLTKHFGNEFLLAVFLFRVPMYESVSSQSLHLSDWPIRHIPIPSTAVGKVGIEVLFVFDKDLTINLF